MIALFEDNEQYISQNDTKYISQARYEGFHKFREMELPGRKDETWKNTNLAPALAKEYYQYLQQEEEGVDLEKVFTCTVHNFETDQISFLNGWHIRTDEALKKFPNGVIAGSLAEAMRKYPELVEKHYAKYAESGRDIFMAMNTAFAQDGMFIYVPDNVEIVKPIQMISILNHSRNLLVQNRNLVILGKNSKFTLVHCDDSTNHQASFNNSVTEIFMDENSELDHYKLQNLNDDSTLLNSTWFHQSANSRLTTYALSLNGGLIRNFNHVKLNGRGASANVYGLYLLDKKQHVDNRVFVDHAVPECQSNELFKGILDDESSAVFNGHILVRKDAQKTNAYQNNKNILLTDKATANARPFLEIYADDVKCSHGATVGQLDSDALFLYPFPWHMHCQRQAFADVRLCSGSYQQDFDRAFADPDRRDGETAPEG